MKRKQIYTDLNDLMLDEAWMYPLAGYDLAIVSSTRVRGISRPVRGGTEWVDAWIAK